MTSVAAGRGRGARPDGATVTPLDGRGEAPGRDVTSHALEAAIRRIHTAGLLLHSVSADAPADLSAPINQAACELDRAVRDLRAAAFGMDASCQGGRP